MTFHSLFSFRANPNAETLDQFDLVAIELVDKRPTDAATGGASRPASPSGIVLSKYEKSIDHQSSVLNIVYCLFLSRIISAALQMHALSVFVPLCFVQ